jgi:hypothetical protein
MQVMQTAAAGSKDLIRFILAPRRQNCCKQQEITEIDGDR